MTVLRINRRTITPKALTAGIVAFTIGVAGAGAYVDRMQSFTDYENVAFDKAKADAGVLGTSDERKDETKENKAAAASATGSTAQTTPAMSSTSTVAGSGSTTTVQPATGSTAPTGTYLAPGMGAGAPAGTGGTGTTTNPTGTTDTSITDTLTAPIYEGTCVDTCVLPVLPQF